MGERLLNEEELTQTSRGVLLYGLLHAKDDSEMLTFGRELRRRNLLVEGIRSDIENSSSFFKVDKVGMVAAVIERLLVAEGSRTMSTVDISDMFYDMEDVESNDLWLAMVGRLLTQEIITIDNKFILHLNK